MDWDSNVLRQHELREPGAEKPLVGDRRTHYNAAMRDALFGLMVAAAVSIGTGVAVVLLVLIAMALGVAQ